MLRRNTVTIGIVLAVLATVALSQEPRGRGRGFDGFMFAGPGGPPGSAVMLLGMPEVQQELAIADEQRKRVDELMSELQEQMQASFGNINFQELANLSEEERMQRFEESRKKADEANRKADEKLGTILDAKQMERLNQLRLQRDGVAAFGRPDVAKQLALSEQQQNKIREIEDASRPQFGGPGGFGGPPDFARIEEQRQKAQTDILAVLTDIQRAKFAAMKGKEFKFPEPQFGFGPGGPGGPGGPMGQERKVLKQFDKDGDGILNQEERQAARESLKSERGQGRGGRVFGPPGGGPPGGGPPGGFGRGNQEPAKPGPHVSPDDVKSYPDADLYEPTVLRTLFLEFDNEDWEAEVQDFHATDVEVPATLTVDGKKYPNVGVHFRGMSSYGVPAGYKRSLNLKLDLADPTQRLYGYKTLNLLNSHEDPTFLHTVLYAHVARQFIPAPKANCVKLVINGESWGVYTNAQQFNKEFVAESFGSSKGARWKVRGNPGADGGLRYLGEDIAPYRQRFDLKSEESEKAWKALVALCRTLNQTPLDDLEAALEPILDIDGALKFLALDIALINGDGYWTRASDYSLFRDKDGKFHVIPSDMNEVFGQPMGPPGFFGGPGGPGGPDGGPGGRPGGPGGSGFGPGPGGEGPQGQSGGGGGGRPGGEGQQGQRGRGGRPEGDGPPLQGGGGVAGVESASPQSDDRPRAGGSQARPQAPDRGPGGRPGGGPRGGGGGGGGIELDPFVGLDNARMPLRSRLLAVPSLRARYLQYVREIAQESLDWNKLGPVVAQYRELIDHEVELDTRKLESFAAFKRTTADEIAGPGGGGRELPLRSFVDQRRKYLLDYKEKVNEPNAASSGSGPSR